MDITDKNFLNKMFPSQKEKESQTQKDIKNKINYYNEKDRLANNIQASDYAKNYDLKILRKNQPCQTKSSMN